MLRYLSRSVIRGKRVLLRVDFNVPIGGSKVSDDFDLIRALPTIRWLIRQGSVAILLSHHSDERQSLAPVARHLTKLLGRSVLLLRKPFGLRAVARIRKTKSGAVFLVENLRFWRGEKSNAPGFARRLARLGEVFINDAFGELHRPYASIIGIPRFLPSAAGPLVAAELEMLDRFGRAPRRPLVVILGGAKVSTKISPLRRFRRLADQVLVGGVVANTLLASCGVSVGRSAVERIAGIRRVARSPKILLPVDALVARARSGRPRVVSIGAVGRTDAIYDIGPKTRALFRAAIRRGRTVIWNGPLGMVEERAYTGGTAAIARSLLPLARRVLIGGGDTVAFLGRMGLARKFTNVSTGGGAMMVYLAGERLPGLEALKR